MHIGAYSPGAAIIQHLHIYSIDLFNLKTLPENPGASIKKILSNYQWVALLPGVPISGSLRCGLAPRPRVPAFPAGDLSGPYPYNSGKR